MKKIFLSLMIAGLVSATVPSTAQATDHRPAALVVLGGLTAGSGLYLLCKEKKSFLGKIFGSVTGLAMIAAGAASIVMSHEAITEFDSQCRKARYGF